MEILFLNTLNAKLYEPMHGFIKEQATRTDVFCLQEVYGTGNNMSQLCRKLLPLHVSFSASKTIENDYFGQETYIGPRLRILSNHTLLSGDSKIGLGVVTSVEIGGIQVTICNFHGRSRPGNKLDTPDRVRQSQLLIEYFETIPGRRIIGGDFNLDINTESLRLFEEAGYCNLIKSYGIRTTRNRIAWEKYPESPQKFCDYVFVSPECKVRNISVPENEISDHLPMIVSIE